MNVAGFAPRDKYLGEVRVTILRAYHLRNNWIFHPMLHTTHISCDGRR